ncbi:sulfatase [Roseibaca sp. V10]|uniref:Sulfatase n=1 Tax=Roseinatronobacter domitianus TaxID=2940293 RepID=A0ABT0M033_9RHOB|nr:sulfatase-like hydrolase/transferase [Roseibaca domitiana]MCL1628232.1 sulfatase [Roseibaca domitiana]
MTRVAALAILFLVLIQPNHPQAMTWGALAVFPLELPVIVAALLAFGPGRAGIALRILLVAAIWTIAVLKLADFATFTAFNRGFNLVVDYHLLPAAWMLAQGSLGGFLSWLALVAIVLGLGALGWLLWWATGVLARVQMPKPARVLAGALVPVTAIVAVAEIGAARGAWTLPQELRPPGAAFTARVGLERVEHAIVARRDLARFVTASQNDPMVQIEPGLERLGTRDMVLIFVESYGRSSHENPLYAPTHRATLRRAEAKIGQAGLAIRSGWARAPMVGGQSWLTHGSVASGLWLDTQSRYRALLASPRRTLFHFAAQAGRRTVAIMPAHVLPWPEGRYFGFDAIYNADDLGYRGQPFNWVTMPDQFTLTAFERLEQSRPDRAPLVAQIALVSSHAPWVPVPQLLPWDALGDGRIFDPWALSGDPPEVVWRDHDRVRDQFRQATDYSLETVGDWAARQGDTAPLIVVMGDHEPARFVSGVDGFDVPLHVIGPPDLLALFDGLGWVQGMLPDPATPSLAMDALRDLLLTRLSTDAAP